MLGWRCVLRLRGQLGGGVELRFGLREEFEFTSVKKDSTAASALIDLHSKARDRQHLRAAFGHNSGSVSGAGFEPDCGVIACSSLGVVDPTHMYTYAYYVSSLVARIARPRESPYYHLYIVLDIFPRTGRLDGCQPRIRRAGRGDDPLHLLQAGTWSRPVDHSR